MQYAICCILATYLSASFGFSQSDSSQAQRSTWSDSVVRIKVDSLAELAWQLRFSDTVSAFDKAVEGLLLARKNAYLSGQIDCLNRKAILFEFQGKHHKAIESYSKGLEIALASGDVFAIGRAYHQIAVNHRFLENYDTAIEFESHALEQFRLLQDSARFLSMAYANRAANYHLSEQYDLAMADFHSSLRVLKEVKGEAAIYERGSVHHGMGLLFEELKMYRSSLKEFQKSLEFHQLIDHPEGIALAHLGQGSSFFHLDQLDSAFHHYQIILQQEDNITRVELVSSMYHNLGIIYTTHLEYDSAKLFFEKSLKYREQLGNRQLLSQSHKDIGRLFFQLEEYDQAKKHLISCLKLAKELNDLSLQSEANLTLAYVYGKLDNAEKVVESFSRSTSIQDSIEGLQSLAKDLEVLNKQGQIELQATKLKLAEEEKRSILTYGAAIVFFLLFVISIIIIFWLRSQQKAQMIKKNSELEKANATILGKDKERERIGEELHDFIGGTLSHVQTTLGELEKDIRILEESKQAKFDKANELLDSSVDYLRDLSRKLGNSILKNLGIVSAMEDYLSDLRVLYPINVEFTYLGIQARDRLPDEMENHLFHMLVELANNTVNHSGADLLSISMIKENKHIEIVFMDNGIGFNPNQKRDDGSMGLLNLRSRLDKLHGTYHLDTRKGVGATYTIQIPIK